MSNIDSEPYFREINSEVMGYVDALVDQDIEANTPADYLLTIEDDVDEIKEVYQLTPEELIALAQHVCEKLQNGVIYAIEEEGDTVCVRFYVDYVRGR